MKVRKGFIYALLLAIGLLLWTQVADTWSMRTQPNARIEEIAESEKTQQAWSHTEAVHACAMKARELHLDIQTMRYQIDNRQGNIDVVGNRDILKKFYQWIENEGQLQEITSVQFDTADEQNSRMSVQYRL